MKYLITISYDGSKYWGLQKLKGKNTVQGELEEVLSKLEKRPISVKAAGRTDRGVHAYDQKCHFELNKPIEPYRLKYYINRSTSKYLFVKECRELKDEKFHARFSVKSKIYLYKINIGEYDPTNEDYFFNYNKNLNIKLMKKAAKILTGAHNYRSFVIGNHKTYESIIDYITVKKKKNIITIEIKGKAFYTYMVRNIVKIIILYGNQEINLDTIKRMLNNQEKVIEYSKVPAGGLYLKKIEY